MSGIKDQLISPLYTNIPCWSAWAKVRKATKLLCNCSVINYNVLTLFCQVFTGKHTLLILLTICLPSSKAWAKVLEATKLLRNCSVSFLGTSPKGWSFFIVCDTQLKYLKKRARQKNITTMLLQCSSNKTCQNHARNCQGTKTIEMLC